MIVLGLLILLFPFANQALSGLRSQKDVETYDEALSEGLNLEYATQYNEALDYNKTLSYRAPKDAFSSEPYIEDEDYDRILNIEDTGMMCYLEIPAISLKLPVYHNSTPDGLSKGAVHMLGSSLPIGGKNSHSVIAAHTGYNGITLFDNLDQLKDGDRFYINVLGKTLCYEVDQIKVVKPEEIDEVAIVEGEDLITLVTCTPYGINSHRLLVRGHNVPYQAVIKDSESGFRTSLMRIIIGLLFVVIGALAAVMIFYLKERRRKGK